MKPHRWRLPAALVLGAAACAAHAWQWQAVTELEFLAGNGWRAEGIDATVSHGEDGGSLRLALESLQLPTPLPTLSGVTVVCPALTLGEELLACETASLALDDGREAALRFRYQPESGAVAFAVEGLDLAPGVITVTGESGPQGWQLGATAAALPAGLLNQLVGGFVDLGFASAAGPTTLSLELAGGEAGLAVLELGLASPALDFASADGLRAAEDLRGELNGRWEFASGAFSAELRLDAGQLYWDPVFVQPDPDADPIVLRAAGHWRTPRLQLEELYLRHPDVIKAEGRLTLTSGAVQSARLEVLGASVDGLYNTYLRPALGPTSWPALSASGYIKGAMLMEGGELTALETSFLNIGLALENRNFALEDLTGWLDWRADGTPQEIRINWASAYLYDLPLGSLNLMAESRGDRIELVAPARLPVLDGALVLEALSGSLEPFSLTLDGRLEPLSLERLSALLDWPVLAGTVAGVVPGMRYTPGLLAVGGEILIQVFGGEIGVESLRLEDPMGATPRLLADLDIQRLDLGSITRTFDIGSIQGQLSGRVQDLVLEDWQPVRFDAYLATPEDNPGTRRISQRAVETLSSVGGAGASAALSRGVLNLFDEFGYTQLGIQCRLENGVCQMGGVAPAGQDSYYLVEGGGLPRIDVIGYTRRVDWQDLLNRLQAAARSGAPQIR